MTESVHTPEPVASLMETLGGGQSVSLDAERGFASQTFTVRPEFCHSGYICQGGFVAGWIDSAMAQAVIAKTNRTRSPATLEMKVTYLKAATKGMQVTAEGWVEKIGKQVAFVEGRVLNEAGEVLAKATSTVQLMEIKTG